MSANTPLWNLAPSAQLLFMGALVAALPLAWVAYKTRGADSAGRMRALTWVTLFLTFDLVLFGAFTRLTDSGLGCPDWPGCYGSASPVGAALHIDAAEAAQPTGPVSTEKAWIEMIHRYLASGVGGLIVVMTVMAWRARRQAQAGGLPAASAAWATLTLVWVCLQGLFGALTVTLKLYPAIVTLHLMGGMGLLALLALQAEAQRRAAEGPSGLQWPVGRAVVLGFVLLVLLQMALGGWVSTNYAVLACPDFPQCHGQWWPAMNWREAFTLRRELGMNGQGGHLSMQALVAIHYAHRLLAYAVLLGLALWAWAWWRQGQRGWAAFFAGVAAWQLGTGVSNVVLGWPLVAAVAHTGGAAALVVGGALLWRRARFVQSAP